MADTKPTTDDPRAFVYHSNLPPLPAVLLIAPLLLVFLSMAAALVAGGTAAAFLLPLFLRGRVGKPPESDSIELRRDQYSRVDGEPRRLPPA